MTGKTMFEKIWESHVIREELGQDLLFVDRQLAGDPGILRKNRGVSRDTLLKAILVV